MSAIVIDGNELAKTIRNDIRGSLAEREAQGFPRPGLCVLLVGNDRASEIYVRLKRRDCDEVGIRCDVQKLPEETSENELIGLITRLNRDRTVDGILVQLPLPPHIDAIRVIELIDPRKDVDGVTPHNLGMLTLREPAHRCCTPKGVMSLLDQIGLRLHGLHATVVGASNHVGRPMGLELLLAGCTVTTVHKFTPDTKDHVRRADIVVSATGKGGLITADWIKPGAVVIDVGIEPQPDGTLRGDVDFDEVVEVAGWITPVPGGVGPMTRVSILQNVLDAASASPP